MVVTTSANGTIVHLTVGQRLGVQLTTPSDSAEGWSDVSASGALYRIRLYTGGFQTDAVFAALATSAGEQVTATTDLLCRHQDTPCASPTHSWSVTVVVDPAPSSPSPTSSPASCYAYPPSASEPHVTVLQAADSGRTVSVGQGDAIRVYLGGSCPAGGGYQAATAGGPLYREGASDYQPGATFAAFRAVGTGRATVTATTDAPCLHTSPRCAIAQQLWTVTVEVARAGCTLTGPADVRAGSPVPLSGRVAPGAGVQIWFRQRGATDFVVRRTLTAASDGTFTALYAAYDDYRWYATAGACTTPPGVTRVTPTVSGPATSRRGSTVMLVVRGPAGAAAQVWMRPPGGAFSLRRSGTLDRAGTYRTSYVATSDQRYYAVTGPDRRVTSAVLTQVR